MVPVLRKKRYWLGVLLILAAVFIIFLPFLLSTPSITRLLVSRINETVPGTVHVGSWLIGWQQGFLCQDIVYEDEPRGVRISVPRVTGTQGLVELMLTPRNLGLVTLESPVVEMSGLPGTRAPLPSQSDPSTSPGSGMFPWDKLAMQLQVRDGTVKIQGDKTQALIGFQNIDLHSGLSVGEIHYDLQFRNLDGQGDFAFKGSFNLPTGSNAFLETLLTETEVNIHDFQIREYLTFANRYRNLPAGDGIINAQLHFKSIGMEDFEISGSAQASGLHLSGGMLGEDTPSLNSLSVSLEKGQWSKLFWSIQQLRIRSEAGSLDCSVEARDDRARLNSSGSLNVPILFDKFPHLLRVQEKAFVETGILEFEADFRKDGEKGKFDFMSKLEDLGGLFDGRPFSWDTPFTAILHGENDGLDFNIRRLQVESPFLQAFGQGDLSSFTLEASADLGKALIALNKLFEHPWAGSGELELSADASAVGIAGRYEVTSDLNISHFSLSRFDRVVVPNQHFSVVSSGQLPMSLLREKNGSFDLQFALSSWLGEIFFAASGNRVPEGLTETRFSTDTNLRLDSLSSLVHSLDIIQEQAALGGELQVQAAGYADGNLIGLDELNSKINHFTFTRNKTQFSDREVRLYIDRMVDEKIPSLVIHDLAVVEDRQEFFRNGAGTNSIDLAGFGIYLHDIIVDGEFGKIQLDELAVGDWHKPLTTLRTQGAMVAGLEKLTPLLQNTQLLDGGTNLAGAGKLLFRAGADNKTGRYISTDLHISDFSMPGKREAILPKHDLRMTLQLEGETMTEDIAVKNLYLDAFPLELSAEGVIDRKGDGGDLSLHGFITPKLGNISSVLRNGFDIDITMRGEHKQSFDFRYRLPVDDGENPAERISITTRLDADRVRYKGIDLEKLAMPFSAADGMLQADLQARMNDGRVDLPLRGDLQRQPPLLQVPEKSKIMTGVELEKPLVEGILQGVHPFFGILASPSGRLDVMVDSLAWPITLQGENDAEFSVQLDVSRVSLDGSGMLRRILAGFSLEDEPLKLRDAFIRCSAAEGRIACSPVRILVADSEMVLNGSVGMDKSLDYILDVPITTRLVSPEVYQFLEGATVRVPIGGTVKRPTFDQQAATAAIRDLVKEAAIKVVEKQANKLLPELEGVLGKPGKKENE